MFQNQLINIWWTFFKQRKWIYFIGVIFVLITNICQIYSTILFGQVIDFFIKDYFSTFLKFIFNPTSKESQFIVLFLVLVIVRIVLTLARMGWRLTLARQTHMASADLKNDIWESAQYFKRDDFLSKFNKGVLMNSSNSDVNAARLLFGFSLVAITDIVFLSIFSLISMFLINPLMAIFSCLPLFFVPYFIKKISDLESIRYNGAQKRFSLLNEWVAHAVASMRLQKISGLHEFWYDKLYNKSYLYSRRKLKSSFVGLTYSPVMGGAAIVSLCFLFFIGIYQVKNGHITVGEFVAIQGLMMLLQYPLMELGLIFSELRRGVTSLDRLNQIYINEKDSKLFQKGESPKSVSEVFKVKNLSFYYEGHDKLVLNNVSFSVSRGEKLGISGPIGSGKSTLIGLLSGLMSNYKGEIFFYNTNLKNFDRSYLRREVATVFQKKFLFADTIRFNIALEKKLSDEEIWKYLEIAQLSSNVKMFPQGINTHLGEMGVNLSGGQKQRLTIARALARRPNVLILDDALSSVDTITEKQIIKNLIENLRGTTFIWSSNRKSTLSYCDNILELKNE